jgi:hypothetical protein
MTLHLLVRQLHFARSELIRGLKGVSEQDGIRRVMPMNCISWMVGHVANQEQRMWVTWAQGKEVVPSLNELVGYGMPASTPPLKEMWVVWRKVTREADKYLATLTPGIMQGFLLREGKPTSENIGTLLLRNILHYWYHIGEASSVRQLLGHTDLPQFVGNINHWKAAYEPEK